VVKQIPTSHIHLDDQANMPRVSSSKVFYIPLFERAKEWKVLGLTCHIDGACENNFTPKFTQFAKHLVRSSPPPPTIFTVSCEKWYSSSSMTITDQTGMNLADWKSPIKSHGCIQLTSPADSCHCEHRIDIVPQSTFRRTYSFVKDSVTYVWESLGRSTPGFLSLYREIGATRKQVAHYESHSGRFKGGGILVLHEKVGELVAVLTCMAMLNQCDSLSFPSITEIFHRLLYS
jgi:hypothetical protein